MDRGVTVALIVAVFLCATVGCAPKAVILSPGAVPMRSDVPRTEGPAAWSLWISESGDARPEDKAGQRLGTLYSRFEKTPQSAFLNRNPEEYLREQLSRYLLHRGLESSGPQTARVHLSLSVEEFRLVEKPGAVWDEVTVRVVYSVHFADPSGRDLGHVRLEGQAEVKSPLDTVKQTEKAFRGALGDTFEALARSEIFQRILSGRGG